MPELSIIIVNYKTKKLTLECLESIVSSQPRTSYEIILIDNASEDGLFEDVKKKSNVKPYVKTISNTENLGFAKAANQGMRVSHGRYMLLLNSDTRVTRGSIDVLVDFAKETKDAGVVGAKLINLDGTTQPSCYYFPTIKAAIDQFWLGKNRRFDKFYPKALEASVVDSVVGAAFLITPAAREKAGFFDHRYFMYFEDMDYCRRVTKFGLKVYYLPSAKVIHHHGASGKALAGQKRQWQRAIPSSKIYHGVVKHYILNFILWSGQKWQKLLG